MLVLARIIHDSIHQYPLWSLIVLGTLAVCMGIFTGRQLLQGWKHFKNKRKVLRQIRQHFSQNKKSSP